MREAEGVPTAQDAEPFWVQDYSIAADQNETIRAAMLEPRRLPKWQMDAIHLTWVCYSPADHDPVTGAA